jgi:hypothetical protein
MFGLLNTLRSLTTSPITRALDEAHRMVRRLETGGAVPNLPRATPRTTIEMAPRQRAQLPRTAGDFVVPCDIDPVTFADVIADKALVAKSLNRDDLQSPVQMAADGHFIIPRHCVARLGGGSVDRGRDILDRVVAEVRARLLCYRVRVLTRNSQPNIGAAYRP